VDLRGFEPLTPSMRTGYRVLITSAPRRSAWSARPCTSVCVRGRSVRLSPS